MTRVQIALRFFLPRGKLISINTKSFSFSLRRLCLGTKAELIDFDHCENIFSQFRNSYQVHRHLTQTSMRIYSENWNGACAEVVGVRVEVFRRYQRKGLHLCYRPQTFCFLPFLSFYEFDRIDCKCFRLRTA